MSVDTTRAIRDSLRRALELVGSLRPAVGTEGPDSVNTLADELYARWYIRPHEAPRDSAPRPFVGTLRAAHVDSKLFEPGWRVASVSTHGRIVAQRGAERRLVGPIDYVSHERPGAIPRPGQEIRVVTRLDSTRLQEGFWVTHTAGWTDEGNSVRTYWNLSSQGLGALVHNLTSGLRGVAEYTLKIALPTPMLRADHAVLFLGRERFVDAAPVLAATYDRVAGFVEDEVPELTLSVRRGVSVAEDPGSDKSFGTHRCRLIAEGLMDAWRSGCTSDSDLFDSILHRFDDEGIPSERPHLSSRSAQEYAF